jgi:hypothetical protein
MMNRILCAWASWRRAWQYFDYNMFQYSASDLKNALLEYKVGLREIEYWQDRLEEIHKDCLGASSWDQQFWMTIWLTKGRGICPNSNLSSNIGFDQYGTHTKDCSSIASKYAMEPILPLVHPTSNKIQREADLLFQKNYFCPWEYGISGLKRLPYRLNKRLKHKMHYRGSWKNYFKRIK